MYESKQIVMDGAEAAAYVAYRTNEVCAIYPITPSSGMSEFCDQWSAEQIPNMWDNVPVIMEMQSEGGAAGTLHGALQTGALTTTFTSSQGLLLMLPNMFKIAGELTPCVFHVAARSLATQGLSIFGDHQDVMSVRSCGFAQLVSINVQESHDMALIAQRATLKSRIPFMHFFDGFRTSHEINKINLIPDEVITAMIDDDDVLIHRSRALNPDSPVMRGTAQNPDTYFQSRESSNPYYLKTPDIVTEAMNQFADLTGREYQIFEYFGALDASKVIVVMGSGAETVKETVNHLLKNDEKIGVINVRLYRPFYADAFLKVLPDSVKRIAVLDRTKEPGGLGEPLYQDVITALTQAFMCQEEGNQKRDALPLVIGGRYGLSSKEFTPSMVQRIYQELDRDKPKNNFTIGINDDVTFSSLDVDEFLNIESSKTVSAIFYGLGADGTVGANKNSIKIIGENPNYYTQGYFVYDSKKSGSRTESHLRFGPEPIHAPYLIESASFVACHQFNFVEHVEMLDHVKNGAVFLLNSPYNSEQVWQNLPFSMQRLLIEKEIKFYVIDAEQVAVESGMGKRINTIMQTCFFALSGVMEKDLAISKIKKAIEKSYAKKGAALVEKNFNAVDQALAHLKQVSVPASITAVESDDTGYDLTKAPEFVQRVTSQMLIGKGDLIPVSMIPDDGSYPTGTTQWEKRDIAHMIPIWESELCIQCGNCSFVCPHGAIRAKYYDESRLEDAPDCFKSEPITARGFPEVRYTLQVYAQDCTGCNLCVQACPAVDPHNEGHKAINMQLKAKHLEEEITSLDFFTSIPYNARSQVDFSTVRGVQFLQPLFEFSGACSGCGETPYLKVLTQLFGDRMLVANATGCSSIYGGNLPTTPWAKTDDGRGPAWSNSLFEDNAEFGLGYRLTVDKHLDYAHDLLKKLANPLIAQAPEQNVTELLKQLADAPQLAESEVVKQRERVATLKTALNKLIEDDQQKRDAKALLSIVDQLVRRSVWIIGGDGWAYDIGYGGVDHVLASGRDVNILVMDTEVYSNTGGQSSKATPAAAVAKFASGGKAQAKKDLALQAISYGNVYVAKIALGASPQQTLKAIREAEAYKGPSLIIAYSPCIAHGINMEQSLVQQDLAVK
ncbi:MAG TPA: pyruvate:ferredoxin (flavodoxin) oxidoreductase, partial [Psychromonas hadalis]|nr:pyruvate:ferredoxin (flavodoxin) oxidoreductase [Psychromonas hadalis]